MGSAPSNPQKGSQVNVVKSNPVSPKKTAQKAEAPLAPLAENIQLDVMISYSHAEMDEMKALREALTAQGFVVWVDVVGLQAGVNFFSKIGTAIINARLFITLLSENAILSKYCRDEISLAYVLDKPIFAVHIKPKDELEQIMDLGMRLEFSNITWYDYTSVKREALDGLMDDLTRAKNDLVKAEAAMKNSRNPHKPLKRAHTRSLLRSKSFIKMSEDDFWTNHFKGKDSIDPNVFMEKFASVMDDKLKSLIKNEADKRQVQRIVRRKLVKKGAISKETYDKFCEDEVGMKADFFARIEEFVVERYAITQVFQVESSVRLQAIENLGRYHSAAVIEALTELLEDSDSDTRAVAAITLAKTGITNHVIKRRLIGLLHDEDRLVRESACLALGHLKIEEAVPDLVTIWRTEVMSSVRDAAEMALKKVGGEEASRALHMVGVLSKEIQFLITH